MTGTARCKDSPPRTLLQPLLTVDSAPSTFLKRKGGLFKKAHELSVLCSVDVAVIIFGAGTNKKLHEFSSMDMREMIQRYGCVCLPPRLLLGPWHGSS